jgi:hypothetical protein
MNYIFLKYIPDYPKLSLGEKNGKEGPKHKCIFL